MANKRTKWKKNCPKEQKRKRAANKIYSLLKRSNNKCEYCNFEIIPMRDLIKTYGQENIRLCNKSWKAHNWGTAAIKTNLGWIYIHVATVDHILPLDHPETNHLENLKAACLHCNQLKSKVTNPFALCEGYLRDLRKAKRCQVKYNTQPKRS